MPGHDVTVIGASAGGLKALTAVVGRLPVDLEASIFIVQHVPAEHISLLPQILADTGSLPVTEPRHGDPIRRGVVYVARPDFHLLVGRDSVHVVRGPRENRFRPSVDALFRSAARAFGSRVIGVVLSGLLDDGTIGLQAIGKRGGITVVQDPREAEYPDMPDSALRYAKVDHCLTLAEMPGFLAKAVAEPAPTERPVPADIDIEAEIAEQEMDTQQLLQGVEAIGTRTVFTCPACNGSLWQVGDDEPLRFRCHVGHTFSGDGLLAEQTRSLENALWSAVRLMEEKASFARRMAERRRQGNLAEQATQFDVYAANLDREIGVIRQLIIDGLATQYLSAAR